MIAEIFPTEWKMANAVRNFHKKKNLESMKHPPEKNFEPRNTHEQKFRTNEILTGKNFGSTEYLPLTEPPDGAGDPPGRN